MMTIGHSTLELEAFLRALAENGCTTLVDVRRFPGSRRHPQFGQDRLFAALHEAGIRAVWREGLGGRRAAKKDSVNTGWRNESFRGYADYMQTRAFEGEVDWLMKLADFDLAVVMCAEAVCVGRMRFPLTTRQGCAARLFDRVSFQSCRPLGSCPSDWETKRGCS